MNSRQFLFSATFLVVLSPMMLLPSAAAGGPGAGAGSAGDEACSTGGLVCVTASTSYSYSCAFVHDAHVRCGVTAEVAYTATSQVEVPGESSFDSWFTIAICGPGDQLCQGVSYPGEPFACSWGPSGACSATTSFDVGTGEIALEVGECVSLDFSVGGVAHGAAPSEDLALTAHQRAEVAVQSGQQHTICR